MSLKVRIPREWNSLPQAHRDRITEYARSVAYEAANEQLNKNMRIMLDLYIKMVCVILHDNFGFGERRLTTFLGNHKRTFRVQAKMVADNTQMEYLDRRMAQIFKDGGYPKEFFEKMVGGVE